MSFDLQIAPRQTYLHVTLTGDAADLDYEDTILTIARAALEARLSRILIDWRQVANLDVLTVLDRFDSATLVAEQVARMRAQGLRDVRIVSIASEIRADAEMFTETVAANRGVNVHTARTIAEGLALLGVEPADAP
jgi:hypothetical protein